MRTAAAIPPIERVEVSSQDDIRSEHLRGLYQYWRGKCGGRRCPSRADLSPEEMVPWLGTLSLLDVIDDGDDMVFRLVGVDVVQACGMEYRNLRLSEVDWGNRRDRVFEEYRYVARTGRPLLVRSPLISRDALFQTRIVPKLMLPLCGDGARCDKLLTCFDLAPGR